MRPDATARQGGACITRIATHIPVNRLTDADLAVEHPDWEVDRVSAKTGVRSRAIAAKGETSGDLGAAAASALFAVDPEARDRVDFLIFCTQTPDYLLPSTSCIVQDRLGLSTQVGALDINLGCSGHVYGLSLAKGLIETDQARSVLLITAETYTHIIHPDDRSVRSLFGDAGAATLIERSGSDGALSAFTFGSDGGGADSLVLRNGGLRQRLTADQSPAMGDFIYMNGQDVFAFTRKRVPQVVEDTLRRAGLEKDDIALFVFHQASWLVIDTLRRALGIPEDKCWFGIGSIGNTVSSTIPIALVQASAARRLQPGDKVVVAGFGVGLSWACAVVTWDQDFRGSGQP